MSSTRQWLLGGLVMVLSVVIVTAAFNPAPHTGGDNAGYVTLAFSLLQNGSYTELFDPAAQPHTKYPPVFPALLALFMMLGIRSWAGLKLVAALSTVGAVAVMWLWARRRLGPLPATALALTLALSSAMVYYSHWILSDPTFLVFTLVGLWALDRVDESWDPADGGPSSEDLGEGSDTRTLLWLSLGVAAVGVAYFTRSAGLPLLVAALAWLALRRRYRALAASVVALGLPALLWWMRGRNVAQAQAQYGAEFWLVDPYQPELGQVGLGGLVGRVVTNTGGYLTQHIPGGVVGQQGPLLPLLGILLVGLALAGWGLRCRRRVGPVEIFFPLYAGIILLWPEVWSGDRFALPLFPVLFLYAADAILRGGVKLGDWAPRTLGAVAFLALLVPALGSWLGEVQAASTCSVAAEAGGPFACYGPRWTRFTEAARWSGTDLPEGSAVLTRKPRMFYVLSGVPSRTFPFSQSFPVHQSTAREVGARYVLLDQVDNLAGYYVGSAVQQSPGAWCALRGFGEGEGIGTQMLGLLAEPGPASTSGSAVQIAVCPPDFLRGAVGGASPRVPQSSSVIPLLETLSP